jgi:type IV pilus assembly protein PilA
VTTTAAGKIVVTTTNAFGDPDLNSKILTLAPFSDVAGTTAPVAGGTVAVWRCGNGPTDGTTILAKFLPGSCRG